MWHKYEEYGAKPMTKIFKNKIKEKIRKDVNLPNIFDVMVVWSASCLEMGMNIGRGWAELQTTI